AMATQLYHISEDGNIQEFLPRPSKSQWGFHSYVWAITDQRLHNYLLPRDCPRICLVKNEESLQYDWAFGPQDMEYTAKIFVPINWRERVESASLYRYSFTSEHFRCVDEIAGYYVSKEREVPAEVVPISSCPSALQQRGISIVYLSVDELRALEELVTKYLTQYSIIRWRNLEPVLEPAG
ncbi:MAG: DUF6886 family protein, partial [Bacteroidota bacterium]